LIGCAKQYIYEDGIRIKVVGVVDLVYFEIANNVSPRFLFEASNPHLI